MARKSRQRSGTSLLRAVRSLLLSFGAAHFLCMTSAATRAFLRALERRTYLRDATRHEHHSVKRSAGRAALGMSCV